MNIKKSIQSGEKLPLNLTAAERTLVLEELPCLDLDYAQIIRDTPAGQPILVDLGQLDDFGGYIAAEANHTKDKKFQKKLDRVFQKIQDLLDTYTDEGRSRTVKIEDARKAKMLSDQAVQIADWAAKAFVAAEHLGVKEKPLAHFRLAPAQRDALLLIPGVSNVIKSKLLINESSFSVAEVASMVMALAEGLPDGGPQKQIAVLFLAKNMIEQLQEGIEGMAKPKSQKGKKPTAKAPSNTLYQFNITLKDSKPPIWRRIQVHNCTLDKLHEHIQTAMGWTNSHLHQFEIDGQRYADPMLMEETFEEMNCRDSTGTMLSDFLPQTGMRFRFRYEYDLGDSWDHEVLFEGCPTSGAGQKFPICLEGERACPPEDIGGICGFHEFLEAIADPKHVRHEELMEWSGPFDPEAFDAGKATKAMKKGLPNWRE